ncbi:zinc-ribbon domain-containing protein [Vibrio campbellii]
METLENFELLLPHYSSENSKLPNEVKHNDITQRIWCCDNGHEWKESVKSRVIRLGDEKYGADCLYCNHGAVYGSKYLGETRPDLLDIWDYELNQIDPLKLSVLNTSVWIKCKNDEDHRYEILASGLVRGNRCPICSSKIVNESNSLATTHPEISKQWNYEKNFELKNKNGDVMTPSNITKGCNAVVNWKCVEYDHEWSAKINQRTQDDSSRTGNSSGCPICAGKVALEGFNTLYDTHPEIAEEWDYERNAEFTNRFGAPLTPKTITAGCNKKVHWKCKLGHKWKTAINSRTNNKAQCSRCSLGQFSRQEIRLFTEILMMYPDAQWGIKLPNVEVKDGRTQPKVDLFLPSLNLVIEFDGVYFHSSKERFKTDLIKNNLLLTHGYTVIRIRPRPLRLTSEYDISPELKQDQLTFDAMQMLVKKIISIYPQEKNKPDINVYLSAESFLNSELYEELLTKNGLPTAGQSLAEMHPDIAARWDYEKNSPFTPEMVTAKSNDTYYFVCVNGLHSTPYRVSNLTAFEQTTCNICNGRALTVETCLATVFPDIAADWHPTKNGTKTAFDVHSGSGKRVWWKCHEPSCGHEWATTIQNRTDKKSGCPGCSGRVVTKKNCLMTTHPYIASMWDDEKNSKDLPTKTVNNIKAKSQAKVNLICSYCNKSFVKILRNLITRHEKCPHCGSRFG